MPLICKLQPNLNLGFLVFIMLISFNIIGQNIFNQSDDSLKIQEMYDLAYDMEVQSPDSAISIYKLGSEISKKINYEIGHGRGLQYQGIVHSDQGHYEDALTLYREAIESFRKVPYQKGVAATYVNIGLIHKRRAEFIQAFKSFMNGTKILEELGDTSRLVMAYTAMGAVLSDVEQYGKSTFYQNKSLELAYSIHDSLSICDGLINLAAIDLIENNIQQSLEKLEKGLEVANKINDPRSLALIHNSLSDVYNIRNESTIALENSKIALKNALILGNPAIYSMSLAQTGMNYSSIGQLDSAKFYLESSIELAKKFDISETLRFSSLWMSDLLEKTNNYPEAIAYLKTYQNLEEQETGDRRIQIISGLQMQYETEKKDLEIANQKIEIEKNEAQLYKRNSLITSLMATVILLGIIFFLFQRSLKQKKILAEKELAIKQDRLEQLKKEQELVILQSMMDGEERERTRLAKDLHDGLGGLLSVIKLHYSQVSDTDFLKSDENQKGMKLIDNVSFEARRISHNLMPDALLKFGLIESLKDYCNTIQSTNGLTVNFQSYNINKRFNSTIEINTFRIVQELVNNAIKHSKATELIVQLMMASETLHVTIEDDGIGFNQKSIKKEGIGLGNIKSRVEYLHGTIEFDTQIDQGTSVLIQIPVI